MRGAYCLWSCDAQLALLAWAKKLACCGVDYLEARPGKHATRGARHWWTRKRGECGLRECDDNHVS